MLSGPRVAGERMSPLEIIDRGLNAWNGWRCDVGITTLFIRFDEIWRASCRVGGVLGTIYDEHLRLPREPVVCTRESCTCIAGIKSCKTTATDSGATRSLPVLTG